MKLKNILLLTSILTVPTIINHAIFNKANEDKTNEKNHIRFNNYYKWRFGKIYYNKKGSGTPLLLIHDTLPGSGSHEWNKAIDPLSKYYTVYSLDLLGYGYSDKPKITYSPYLYISLLNDFIQNVIKDKVYVVANGNSSSFTILTNAFNSGLFNKMILVSPKGFYKNKNDSKYNPLKKYILESPILGTSIYVMLTSKAAQKFYIPKYVNDKSNISKKRINEYYKSAHYKGVNSKFSNAAYLANYLDTDISKHMKSIKSPIHVIWGANDELNPIDGFNVIADYAPHASLTVFEDTKSAPHIENPQAFSKVCKVFL